MEGLSAIIDATQAALRQIMAKADPEERKRDLHKLFGMSPEQETFDWGQAPNEAQDEEESSEEIWKEIEKFPGYKASSKGQIIGKMGRIMKQKVQRGYKKITIVKPDGKPFGTGVHRLVALAFLPNPENLPEVDHRDRNRLNCKLKNLLWSTTLDNLKNRVLPAKRKEYERHEIPGEIWKTLEGPYKYPYAVSTFGRVKMVWGGFTRGNASDYMYISLLLKDGTQENVGVHILVARHFLPPPIDPAMIVDHKNTNKHDNRVENLEWITRSENNDRAYAMGCKKTRAVVKLTKDHDFVARFPSIVLAAKSVGKKSKALAHVLYGKGKTACGFCWVFEEDWDGNERPLKKSKE